MGINPRCMEEEKKIFVLLCYYSIMQYANPLKKKKKGHASPCVLLVFAIINLFSQEV